MIITDFRTVCAEAAQAFLDRGWRPVPVPLGEKGPKIQGWPTRQFTAEEFKGNSNIGLKLGTVSGGLVDVDLDCPEAIELAIRFLPETAMIHGRKSKPCSHFWYMAYGAALPTVTYDDVPSPGETHGASLIELRADKKDGSPGNHTLVPPSINPSGEQLCWNDERLEPARLTFEDLKRAVALIAATALLARHWPNNGVRHDCAMRPKTSILPRRCWGW